MANHIDVKIPVIIFREGNKVVAYSPALDLSSCGDTEQHARQKFTEAASIFFAEIHKMGTTEEVLEECGWCKMPDKGKWSPPAYQATEELVKIPTGV